MLIFQLFVILGAIHLGVLLYQMKRARRKMSFLNPILFTLFIILVGLMGIVGATTDWGKI